MSAMQQSEADEIKKIERKSVSEIHKNLHPREEPYKTNDEKKWRMKRISQNANKSRESFQCAMHFIL